MNKIEFSKLENKEDMQLAFNQLKDDYHILFKRHQQLKEVIEEVRKLIEEHQKDIDKAKEFYSDLEDDSEIKTTCFQIWNNQMVRNYALLQILDKVKENK